MDRYIVWPGLALSYMIGEQAILQLRDEAKRKLGDKYNLKNFDDVVLGRGSLPMAVPKEVVDKWIANTLAANPWTSCRSRASRARWRRARRVEPRTESCAQLSGLLGRHSKARMKKSIPVAGD